MICLEGLCGGSAYVNAFYHVGRIGDDEAEMGEADEGKRKREREFRIGATGGADSCGMSIPVREREYRQGADIYRYTICKSDIYAFGD